MAEELKHGGRESGGISISLPKIARPSVPVVIEPGRLSLLFHLSELWRYRELFYFLVWRDVAIRYKQTVLGVLWVVLQPLVTMLVFYLVFNRLARIPSDDLPYPVFVLAGIVPWAFFSDALRRSSESLVNSSNLITKVYFPRLIIPGASSLAVLVDFFFALLVMAGIMAAYRVAPGLEIMALPFLIMLLFLVSLSVGLLAAAVNVRYHDVKFVIPFLVQIWMFATPIVYPLSLIPERYQPLIAINPMTGVVEGFRWALLGRPFPGTAILASTVFTLALFAISLVYFRRVERTFADVV